MSYIYANKYKRFHEQNPQPAVPDPLDSYVCLPFQENPPPSTARVIYTLSLKENLPDTISPSFPPQTLALATLSLAGKATESPRRLREILLPAHRLLHPPADPFQDTLKIPSETYDNLRATLVQAELILLRVLGFELRLPSPMEYLPRYLERAMEDLADAGEDYEGGGKDARAEYGVVEGG
ncbi:MAG: hypothetical protein Q9191_002960, partial [Dirinaria sp. TL-2023a]